MKILYRILIVSLVGMLHAECEEFTDQVSCEADVHCEWHADEMACEDAGHDDHEHCEDFMDQASCEADDHCEWHGDHCEDAHDHGDGDCADTNHYNTEGLALEHDGVEIYSQFQGLIEGSVDVHVNETKDVSVHFIDGNGNEIIIDESIIECYGLDFNVTDSSIVSVETEEHDEHGEEHCEDFMDQASCEAEDHCEWHNDHCEDAHDHGDDDHDDHGGHTFEVTGLSVGSTTFTLSIIHQGHSDYTSLPIIVNVIEEPCLSGDVNGDSGLNILDIVEMANAIANGTTTMLDCSDLNDDNIVNILDIVQLVQLILSQRVNDAHNASIIIGDSSVTINADGYIGGVQMTLKHGSDFTYNLTDKAFVSASNTKLNETVIVIVAPNSNELFTFDGDFTVSDYIVANSSDSVNTTFNEISFSLGNAYPNPFNPTTSLSLTIPENGYVNVGVFNLAGKQVANLIDANIESGTYNLSWNAQNISSGMYLVRAEYGGNISTQKIMLIK